LPIWQAKIRAVTTLSRQLAELTEIGSLDQFRL
jgi:hypothetical protein